jgi:hypothetical protein
MQIPHLPKSTILKKMFPSKTSSTSVSNTNRLKRQ